MLEEREGMQIHGADPVEVVGGRGSGQRTADATDGGEPRTGEELGESGETKLSPHSRPNIWETVRAEVSLAGPEFPVPAERFHRQNNVAGT
jgi:hypothetical protein